MPRMTCFSGISADYNAARFVVLGVPYDRTTSFRPGTRSGPNAIREHSHNFETYMFEHAVDLKDVPMHDAGNLDECGSPKQMWDEVEFAVREISVKKNKFALIFGGEHSITPPSVKAYADSRIGSESISVLILDAHLDFRDSYMDEPYSHACAFRRCCDIVGTKNVAAIGIRSHSAEEYDDIKKLKPNFITSFQVHEHGIRKCVERAIRSFGRNKIYLSLDIDAIDPAYAPGTGTPEPFGITPSDVKYVINTLAHRLVGFDVVEVCPSYDNGNTSALAARLTMEVIASVWKSSMPGKCKEKSRQS